MKLKNYFDAALLVTTITVGAQPAKITVDVAQPGHKIPEILRGIFFEDINMYADGGLHPELVRNRSFEDADTPEHRKLTNAKPLETELDLSGAKNLTGQGRAIALTSESPTDENSLGNPTKVSPKSEPVNFTGACFMRSFPGNSFTVLRLHTN